MWIVAWSPIKNTIFWKSIMRSFRWIETVLIDLGFLLRSAQICKKCTILGNLRTIIQGAKKEIRQMTPFFHLLFELSFWYSFLYLKIVKIYFHGVLLSSILVCKIPEFWRCKLWDQKFASFDSENINIKESEKRGFTFSIEMRTKFVWSPGLLLLVPECYFA